MIAKLYTRFDPWVWSDVITRAATSPSTDLAVAPQTSLSSEPVREFASAAGSTRHGGFAAPSDLATSNKTDRSIAMSWSETSTAAVGYRLYRNGTEVGTSATKAYAYSGLACGTSYRLGVSAYDSSGRSSVITKTGSATQACTDSTPPSMPTGLLASNVAPTSVTLSWQPSGDNVGVAGYRLYVNGAQVGTTSSSAYGFSGLTCSTTPGASVYSFGVASYDAAGNASAVASMAQATEQCPVPPVLPPTTPTGLATSNIGQTSMTLSWNASTASAGLAGYRVSVNGSQVGTTTLTSYNFTGFTCATTYVLGVTAVDLTSAVSGTATLTSPTLACSGDSTPPSTPATLTATTVQQNSIGVSWSASTDNVGVAGYRLYQDGVQIGTTTTTSYAFSSLACSTGLGTAVYTLGVAAFDATGNVSGTRSIDQETLPCTDTTPPAPPTNPSTSGVTQTAVTLSWSPSTDNVGVTGYRLYRNGSQVGSATGTNYSFTGLSCGTTYTLAVAATDAAGNLSSQTSASASTATCSGGAGTANLWVDTSGGSCTRSATAAAYADAAACGSFNAAYQAAQPGDLVYIKGGSYGAQTIGVSSAKTNATSDVTMQTAPSETVTLTASLEILGSHVVLQGESASNRSLRNPYHTVFVDGVSDGGATANTVTGANRTNHVTLRYYAGANFQIGPAANVTFDSNDFGPSIACNAGYTSPETENQITWDGNWSGFVPQNIALTNNLIHDMNTDDTYNCHTGGLVVQAFNGLRITGNKWYRICIYDIIFDEFTGTQAVSGLVMENNWFGPPVGTNDHRNGTNPLYADAGQADIQVKWDGHAASDWLVAYNSFSQGFAPEWGGAPPSYSNFRVLANTGGTITSSGWLFCRAYGKAGVTYAYNVMLGFTMGSNPGGSPACGGTGAVSLGTSALSGSEYNFGALPYVRGSSQNPDLHLAGAAGSTAADNAVAPGTGDYALMDDIDAVNSRPHDVNRDAGSDDR